MLFWGITLALPFVLLIAAEGALRLFWKGGSYPLFDTLVVNGTRYEVASRRVAERWFLAEPQPPTPIPEPFAADKPANGFRVFVLGESAAAGFPYPHNVTFARMLRDVLRDAMPGDSVEVINLGIAATNSFAMLDIVREVLAQRPDAVLVYEGHNEYYGAFGAGSSQGGPLGGSVRVVRAYLALERLRLFMLLRAGYAALLRRSRGAPGRESNVALASRMEELARDQQIVLGSEAYERGVRQFEANLHEIVRRLTANGVRVFVASQASNERDQPPFVAPFNARPGGADSSFAAAGAALASGDTARARDLFARARDLDVVRFRAPGTFANVARTVAQRDGAVFVPVARALADSSPGGIPGHELFLEHVHPTPHGHALIARAFFDAMARDAVIGRKVHTDRLRSWAEYETRMSLTPFDERVALHTRQTIVMRWPFVPVDRQSDYRATYRPQGLLDSLAFMVSRGEPWAEAKLQLAADYERRGLLDSAIAEYRGLVRDAPAFEEPRRFLGRALLAAGRTAEADTVLRAAMRIRPSAFAAFTLGAMALKRGNATEAVALLRQSLALGPNQPATLYQLSLALGLARDLPNARATALELARIAPGYPGLQQWMKMLGLR